MIPYRLLLDREMDSPDKTAFISRDARRITFSQLAGRIRPLAAALQNSGIGKGDVIAALLPNCIEIVEIYIAATAIGAVFQPMDYRFQGEELKNALVNTAVKMIFCHVASVNETLEAILPASLCRGIIGGQRPGWSAYEEMIAYGASEINLPDIDEEADIALFLYSSGSTSEIKCIPVTFRQLNFFPADLTHFWNPEVFARGISLIPLSHISGPIIVNTCLRFGFSYVITDRFTPDTIAGLMEKYHVTWTHTVPSIGGLLLRGNLEEYDLSHLKLIALMGATVPPSFLTALKRIVPSAAAIQGYGLTETSPLLTLVPPGYDDDKTGTIGKALPGVEIRLVDAAGNDVGTDEPGEIVVRGPKVFSGYYGNPDLTDRVMQDGWFHTGDVARRDDDGFYYHLGRLDDLIITGGLNVFPAEVEAAAAQCPFVRESVVYAVPDANRGQVIGMDVCPRDGCEINIRDLRAFLQKHLASYKIPARINPVDAISHTPTGKPIRKSNT